MKERHPGAGVVPSMAQTAKTSLRCLSETDKKRSSVKETGRWLCIYLRLAFLRQENRLRLDDCAFSQRGV